MADIQIKINTLGGEETVKTVNDLREGIKKLEQESSNLNLGSDAFEQAKSQIDELKKKLQDLSKSQQQLDNEMNQQAEDAASKRAERMEKVGNNLQKFAAGLTDAFAGAFIAMGASGKDAEEFNKTLQEGIGIAVGVKGGIEALVAGVELAGPAFEAFNAIMAANPIGAIIVLIAALAAGIYLLSKAMNSEKSESEKLTEALEEQKVAAESLSKARKSEISVMESKLSLMVAQGKSDAEVLKATKDLYAAKKAALEQDVIQLEMAAKITKAKLVEALATDTLWESTQRAAAAAYRATGNSLAAELIEKGIAEGKKDRQKELTDLLLKDLTAVKEAKDNIAKLDIDRDVAVANIQTKINEKSKKAAEERQKKYDEEHRYKQKVTEDDTQQAEEFSNFLAAEEEKRLAKQKEANDAALELQRQKNSDEFTAQVEYWNLLDAEAEKQLKKDNLIKGVKVLEESLVAGFNRMGGASGQLGASIVSNLGGAFDVLSNKSASTTDKIQAGLSALGGILDAANAYQKAQADEKVKVNEEELSNTLENLNAQREAELSNQNLTAEQKTAIENKYAQQEYQLKLDEYNKNTAIKKKAFEQDKKLKIASTIITTLQSVMGAVSSMLTIPSPAAPALAVLAGAAVAAMGAYQVSQIEKQKFDAGSPPQAPKISLPSASSISDGGGGSGTRPQSGPDLYQAGTGDINGGANNYKMSAQPIKAYVVSQEVEYSGNMNSVIERRSVF